MRQMNSIIRNLLLEDDDIDYDEYDEYYDDTDPDDIENLNLSVRTYNCLRRVGITTISALKEKTEEELTHVKNLGKKSLEEIKAKVTLKSMSGYVSGNVWFPSKYGLK